MGYAAAGNPEEGRMLVPVSSHAVTEIRWEPVRSKANRERWQGILETAHRTPRRYEQTRRACITSSFRAFCISV
jgi:hypothetical protein